MSTPGCAWIAWRQPEAPAGKRLRTAARRGLAPCWRGCRFPRLFTGDLRRLHLLDTMETYLAVGVAQLGRAPDCGSGGRGFESLHPPHPTPTPLAPPRLPQSTPRLRKLTASPKNSPRCAPHRIDYFICEFGVRKMKPYRASRNRLMHGKLTVGPARPKSFQGSCRPPFRKCVTV